MEMVKFDSPSRMVELHEMNNFLVDSGPRPKLVEQPTPILPLAKPKADDRF